MRKFRPCWRKIAAITTEEMKEKAQPIVERIDDQPNDSKESLLPGFTAHMARYTGITVTVFTKGSGSSGVGYTGVLLAVNREYITLISLPATPPYCPFHVVGAITHIPSRKVAGLVHNTV